MATTTTMNKLVSLFVISSIVLVGFGSALRVVVNKTPSQLNVTCTADDAAYTTRRILSIEIIKQEGDVSIMRLNDVQALTQGPGKTDNMKAEGKIEKYNNKTFLTLSINNPTNDDATAYKCQVFFVDENNDIASKDAYSTVIFNTCPNGWTHYKADQTCLKIYGKDDYRKYLQWDETRSACQKFGGDLVKIRDEEKNNFVLKMTTGMGYGPFIGIKNIAKVGINFQYVDGSALGSFHPWALGNPSGEKSEHVKCVTFSSGNWVDNYCIYKRPYVCSIHSN